jgi:hypothetical protein
VSAYVVHYTFAVDVDAPKPVEVRGGGVSYHEELIQKFGSGPRPSRWFVAELGFDGRTATALVEAKDRDAARKLLPVVAANGLPAAAVELASGKHDAVVIARMRERTGTAMILEPVDGSAAITATVPERPSAASGMWMDFMWTGDVLVLAVDAKRKVLRYVVAHDLADAGRWVAAIGRHGWPRAWILGSSHDRDTSRWSALGTVKAASSAACGPEIAVESYEPAKWSIEPRRVAAPPKVAAGAKLSVVLAPNPKDACGRTAHVVRAYAAPVGDPRWWLIQGARAASAAIVE